MGTYVTDTGFNTQTFEINKLYWETQLQTIFGSDIDLDPEQPFGQLVGIFAKRDTDIFSAIKEVYTSRDVDSATGISLDILYAERGLFRIGAGSTFVPGVLCYGDIGTVIEVGKQTRQSEGVNSDKLFSLTGEVTISQDFCRDIEIEIQVPTVPEDYSITLDGTAYPYEATGGDDEGAVALALYNLIIAGDFAGTVVLDGATIRITQEGENFTIFFTTNISLNLIASPGSFSADDSGTITVPQNTLDTIVTPVSGWDSVINPTAGTTGREVETDSEFRIRGANTSSTGNATENAIVNDISNNVAGVTKAVIASNRTDVVNGDGLPPHSFEVVVTGGIDADIAQSIWETQGGGIASFGNVTNTVQDSEGNDQTVYFSRSVSIYIHVKVKRDLYSEEDFPADGDTQIKEAIVAWSEINQPIGKDVIRQRLNTPVYSIPGIEDIEITIDGTASSGDTPTYAADNIVIAIREDAVFDVSRIVVEVLTP